MIPVSKSWCVYGFLLTSVGRIIADYGGSVVLLYSEGQRYPAEYWDPTYVRRFSAPEEAIAYQLVHNSDETENGAVESFLGNFGSIRSVDREIVASHTKRIKESRDEDTST